MAFSTTALLGAERVGRGEVPIAVGAGLLVGLWLRAS